MQESFREFLNESQEFSKGDKVVVTVSMLDKNAKKYNGKTGTVVRVDGKYITVNMGRREVEFRTSELKLAK